MWYLPPHGNTLRDLDDIADGFEAFYASTVLYFFEHSRIMARDIPPIGVTSFDKASYCMKEYLILHAANGLLNHNAVPRRLTQAFDAAAGYPIAYLYLAEKDKPRFDQEQLAQVCINLGLDYFPIEIDGADYGRDGWEKALEPLIDLVSWRKVPGENPYLASVAVHSHNFCDVPAWPLSDCPMTCREVVEQLAEEAVAC